MSVVRVSVSLPLPVIVQVKARMDSIQQRLRTDPSFSKAYPRQVAKEMHQEKQLEEQLAKQVCMYRDLQVGWGIELVEGVKQQSWVHKR